GGRRVLFRAVASTRGGGAAVDGDGHRVRARIRGGRIRARGVLRRRGEAVRSRPRVRCAGDRRRRQRDGLAGAVRAAVARGRRRRRGIDHDIGGAGGGGAAVDGDGDAVRAAVGGRGIGARRILRRGREAVRAGPRVRRAGGGRPCG